MLCIAKATSGSSLRGVGGKGTKKGTGACINKMTVRATGQEVLGFWVDTESTTVSLPQRKVDDLVEGLKAWPPGREMAAMR